MFECACGDGCEVPLGAPCWQSQLFLGRTWTWAGVSLLFVEDFCSISGAQTAQERDTGTTNARLSTTLSCIVCVRGGHCLTVRDSLDRKEDGRPPTRKAIKEKGVGEKQKRCVKTMPGY